MDEETQKAMATQQIDKTKERLAELEEETEEKVCATFIIYY